jgi:hypothetical protein
MVKAKLHRRPVGQVSNLPVRRLGSPSAAFIHLYAPLRKKRGAKKTTITRYLIKT